MLYNETTEWNFEEGLSMEKLLELLEQDCTMTTEQLAAAAGLTQEEVTAARRQYEEDRTVLGYQAVIDWDQVRRDTVTALIEVNVTPSPSTALTASPSASTNTTRWRACT